MTAVAWDETDRGPVRLLSWAVAVLLVSGLGACVAEGANRPADPRLVEARVPGFGEVAFRIQPGRGGSASRELCALLAATNEQRTRGLTGRRDLAGYDGMVFRFPTDVSARFIMRNVPMPLSIAWFAADGRFVSATDMEPCDERPDCPTYGASGPYRYALEVRRGDLARLGVGPGSVLQQGGRCPPSRG